MRYSVMQTGNFKHQRKSSSENRVCLVITIIPFGVISLAIQQGVQVALNSFSPYNILETVLRFFVLAPGIRFIYLGKYLEGNNNNYNIGIIPKEIIDLNELKPRANDKDYSEKEYYSQMLKEAEKIK